jgi:hypothetical protein
MVDIHKGRNYCFGPGNFLPCFEPGPTTLFFLEGRMALDVEKIKSKLSGKTKNQLNSLAREKFGTSIELTDSLETIQDSVLKMFVEQEEIVVKTGAQTPGQGVAKLPEFYMNPITGHVFAATLYLHKDAKLIPCDKKGEIIRG